MRTAFYVRVSTERQQQAQTIEQQVALLRAYVAERRGWVIEEQHIFRDDGHTGAKLQRPGLDALRDQAARAAFDVVVVTAPDRLARNYVYQMVILEELERHGISVVFIDRPPSDDPHEQLVTQIRGAVAEYERTLIADRMRRGPQAKLRAGRLLPWTNERMAIESILNGRAIPSWSRSKRPLRPSCANCFSPMPTEKPPCMHSRCG